MCDFRSTHIRANKGQRTNVLGFGDEDFNSLFSMAGLIDYIIERQTSGPIVELDGTCFIYPPLNGPEYLFIYFSKPLDRIYQIYVIA